MNDLIRVNYNSDRITTSARNLWEFLGKPYTEFPKWFNHYKEYGFTESLDFRVFERFVDDVSAFGGKRKLIDYEITIDMAKELAMLQKTPKGKLARKYFIELEKQWNSPEAIMARALKMADSKLLEYKNKVNDLQRQVDHKTEVIKGVTDDIDIYTKRNILNKVVRHKGANFSERWNELYQRFREVYSVDLKARCEGYNLKQVKKKDELSTIKYAEQFGYIDKLYKIALKLYETDINEILKHLQKIA